MNMNLAKALWTIGYIEDMSILHLNLPNIHNQVI